MVDLSWIGWDGLLPNERLAALGGGAVALGGWLTVRAVFGGLFRKLQARPTAKKKGGKKRKGGRR